MTAAAHKKTTNTEQAVLAKALRNAAKGLGLTQTEVGEAIGRNRAGLHQGIDPHSKPGQLSTYLVRIYRSLYTIVGGDSQVMKHWMSTENSHLGGVPSECVKTPEGLVLVMHYLDSLRGKV